MDKELQEVRQVVFTDTKTAIVGKQRKSKLEMTRRGTLRVNGRNVEIHLGTYSKGSRGGENAGPVVFTLGEWRAISKKIEEVVVDVEARSVDVKTEVEEELTNEVGEETIELIKKLREMREKGELGVDKAL
jgi:hypothetical protein